jgi:hypothetical protein
MPPSAYSTVSPTFSVAPSTRAGARIGRAPLSVSHASPTRGREQSEFAARFEAISTGQALINSDAQIG